MTKAKRALRAQLVLAFQYSDWGSGSVKRDSGSTSRGCRSCFDWWGVETDRVTEKLLPAVGNLVGMMDLLEGLEVDSLRVDRRNQFRNLVDAGDGLNQRRELSTQEVGERPVPHQDRLTSRKSIECDRGDTVMVFASTKHDIGLGDLVVIVGELSANRESAGSEFRIASHDDVHIVTTERQVSQLDAMVPAAVTTGDEEAFDRRLETRLDRWPGRQLTSQHGIRDNFGAEVVLHAQHVCELFAKDKVPGRRVEASEEKSACPTMTEFVEIGVIDQPAACLAIPQKREGDRFVAENDDVVIRIGRKMPTKFDQLANLIKT